MWDIKFVLKEIKKGKKIQTISSLTGLSRNTIKKYRDIAESFGWNSEVDEVTEELAIAISNEVRPGRRQCTHGESLSKLWEHRDWINTKVNGTEKLTISKVRILLERQGVSVPASSLYRFVKIYCSSDEGKTVCMPETEPGEIAEVDFGTMGIIREGGKKIKLHALMVTLSYSRYMYVGICRTQQLEDVINSLEDAWNFFGGVPNRLIVDNMKTAITKAGRYESIFNREFGDYSEHRGFEIDPAVPGKPTQKPKVERTVNYVRENFFKGENWKSVNEVKESAKRWCRETAGKRIHGTTRNKPVEVYEMEEKSLMNPVYGERYDPNVTAELTVRRDQTVMFDKALYTVSTQYIAKKVTVLANSKLVRIYYRGELIKTHERVKPGTKQIDFNDYPAPKRDYIKHDKEKFISRASEFGGDIEKYVKEILGRKVVWQKLRQVSSLFRLIEKYGKERVQKVCSRALEHEIVSVPRLKKMLEEGYVNETEENKSNKYIEPPEKLNFLRDMSSFVSVWTETRSSEVEHGNI